MTDDWFYALGACSFWLVGCHWKNSSEKKSYGWILKKDKKNADARPGLDYL